LDDVNEAQFRAASRELSLGQINTLVVANSLDMTMKFDGKVFWLSPAQILAAKPMEDI